MQETHSATVRRYCETYEGCRGDGVLDDLTDSGSGRTTYCDCEAGVRLREIESGFGDIEKPAIVHGPNTEKLVLFADDVLHALGIHGEIFDGGEAAIDQIRSLKAAQYKVKAERTRIRTELINWLVGSTESGFIDGRRIVDEIDRICPTE